MSDPLGPARPLVPPLYQASVFALPDLDALDAILDDGEPGFFYARDGHPNAALLADELAVLEDAEWGLVCGSGMAAIVTALLGLVKPGGHIVASHRLYGRTMTLLRQELPRFGVATTFVDLQEPGALRDALKERADVVVAESISNPLLRVTDVPALAELAHDHGARLLVDNTFATPVLLRPLEHGADLVMESLTKMVGGHSDLTLGVLCGDDEELRPALEQLRSIWGLSASPFDCWLAQRSLPTVGLRVRAAAANAAALADWLAEQPGLERVIYPGRPDHPDHDLVGRLLPDGRGNLLCFEVPGGRAGVNRFLRTAGIPFSPSLGHATTTCSHPATTSHRYEPPAERQRQGITDGLIRLSVGVEDLGTIQEAITKGLGKRHD
jgi:cystathionine beta-lyase/cystathionine gamma-synthase